MTICKFVHSETYDLVVDVRLCPVYLKHLDLSFFAQKDETFTFISTGSFSDTCSAEKAEAFCQLE